MKKAVLIFVAIFMVSGFVSQAQLLKKINAKDGYSAALEFVKTNKAMTSPKLQFLGTFNETMDYNGLQIQIEFDLSNGTATGWGYFFIDTDDTTKKSAVFVLKPVFGNPLTLDLPGDVLDGFQLEIVEGNYLDNYEWMDSPDMLNKLKENTDFKSFLDENQPFDQLFAVLSVLINPLTNEIDPLWAVSLVKGEMMRNCAVQAVSGLVFCSPIMTSITNNLDTDLEVFPNPANDFVVINSPADNVIDAHAIVYDLYGRKVLNVSLLPGTNQINVSSLTAGVYMIHANNSISKFIKQ